MRGRNRRRGREYGAEDKERSRKEGEFMWTNITR
jgi:hypothetical protein